MKSNIFIKIKYRFVCVLGSFLFALTACTDKYAEFNTNPNGIDNLEIDNLGYAFFTTMQMKVFPIGDSSNPYQRMCNLIGDIYSCYLVGTNSWNGNSNGMAYVPFEDWIVVPYQVAFSEFMPNYTMIKKRAISDNRPDALALADIMKVYAMHRITDMYGPIPYSQLGGDSKSVPYDSQEAIYTQFFIELDEAIEQLTTFVEGYGADKKPFRSFDLIYEGDYTKWLQFANTLKLRLAMRIRYVDPANAKKYAEEAVSNPFGLVSENSNNAMLKTRGSTIINHPLKMIWDDYNDTRMSANMESFLVGYGDPRLPVYFQKATYIGTGAREYMGVRSGARLMSSYYSRYRTYSAPNVQVNTPVQWMVAAESYFLRAEGALIGWNMNGTAEDFYNEGVKKSFEQHGASGASTYILNDSNTPIAVRDYVYSGNSIAETSPYLSSITIKWDDDDSQDKNLERIMTQKWLALFPDGQEAWSEFRRTAYPKLFPIANNLSGGIVDTEKQIRRIPYPSAEYNNPDSKPEVTKAVSELLNGEDNGGTQLWWDKK